MGKKIYIITLGAQYMFSNVGTFLQHWALRRILSKMGHNPVRVSLPDDYKHIALNNFSWTKSLLKRIIGMFFHYLCFPKYAKLDSFSIKSLRDYVQAKKFRRDFILNVGDCIEDTTKQADALILGGDQVFNNEFKYLTNISALKYISFAASTDWRKKSESTKWKEEVSQKSKYLSKYK